MAKRAEAEGAVKRVLMYENRKISPCFWDASTEELEAGAFLALFKHLDEDWQVYSGLDQPEKPYRELSKGHPEGCMCEPCISFRKEQTALPDREKEREHQLKLYQRAKKGEAAAARALLKERQDYEYEKFTFVTVESTKSSYPPREWGVTKPCGEAYVAANGVYKWSLHGRIDSREKREARYEYGYAATQKEAIEYLTKGRILHFDAKSKTEVDLGDETWKFRERKEGQTDADWMYRGLGSESELAKTGIPILEAGSMKPGKVIKLTEQICGGCKRDMERFK